MLRLESETGWWLVTHPDHARLAGAFAEAWGNDRFVPPEPRRNVLLGIRCHDDGWAARDAAPQITREGKPSAFSTELVGKYSAFEEIDLEDYLAVRERAVLLMAEEDAYAGLLVSMHTYNLLTERADRSTIRAEQLPLLDRFLASQREFQQKLVDRVRSGGLNCEQTSDLRLRDHFRLLQATDNLSLLSCVGYRKAATLLHALPLKNGSYAKVDVEPLGDRHFRLDPYPFSGDSLTFVFPARHVEGKTYASAAVLQEKWQLASLKQLTVTVCA
jgi:Protein of unknown function (DUF3891)